MESSTAPPEKNASPAEPSSSETFDESFKNTYLTGFKLAILLAALCMCNFLVALDTTIIATAIPVISEQFHALEDVGWYVSAYFLTNCAFQLLYGKLYSLYALKPIFIGAVALFEIGSLICAVAPSSPVFIFGRALAGLGGAGIFSGGKFDMSFFETFKNLLANTVSIQLLSQSPTLSVPKNVQDTQG